LERRPTVIEGLACFSIAFLTIASIQLARGWWLDSGRAVGQTAAVLAIWSAAAALWGGRPHLARAVALWLGACSASAIALFWIGPGNIWPIVLGVAATIAAAAVSGGTLAGIAAAGVFRRQPRSARPRPSPRDETHR
jgi:hypothetical protein